MSIELWLAFAAASTILVIIPGPTVLLVVAYALGAGRRTALWTVIGVFFGDLVAITASVLGLGVLLAASATLFTVLKFVGGAYLIYLGFRLFTAPVEAGQIEAKAAAASGPKMAFHAFAVTATNPKGLVFFRRVLAAISGPGGTCCSATGHHGCDLHYHCRDQCPDLRTRCGWPAYPHHATKRVEMDEPWRRICPDGDGCRNHARSTHLGRYHDATNPRSHL